MKHQPTFFDAPPAQAGYMSAALDLVLSEITDLTRRIKRASGDMYAAWGYSDSLHFSCEDMCELVLSISATASLTAFQRHGERWELDLAGENSSAGMVITGALHGLRAELFANEPSIRRYLSDPKKSARLRKCIAVLCLAMSIVPPSRMSEFAVLAGLDARSGDPVGDAQLAAQDHFADPPIPVIPSLPGQ